MDSLYWKALITLPLGYCVFLAVAKLGKLRHHPLQSYPGPKLAAFTWWYKAYYELIKDGKLVEQLEKLHEKYGSVVRIGPEELHFSDPLAFASIYAPGSKFYKEPIMYASFGEDESSVGYIDPQEAKARREVLSPLFSRRAILKLENVIQEKVDKLVARAISLQFLETPINMSRAFRSTTTDIITSYCFDKCTNTLDAPELNHPLLLAMESASLNTFIFKYFPLVRSALLGAPEWLTLHLSPQSKGFADFRREVTTQIDQILADPGSLEHADREIIYHHLMTPQRNHPVPSRKSLQEEASNLIFAGADTVGNTCAIGTFYLLKDKNVRSKLLKELDAAWPEKESAIGYESLERLPYLTAVIKESLRMSHGVVTPMPRVVAPADALISGHRVPAGTIVSMGSTFLHWNLNIFADPLTFSPERWLQPKARELDNYLVPFSRGPRSCLGVNLAWCELYLIFANVFRKLELELYDTTVDDFKFKAYFLPHYGGKFLGVRVQAERSV